MKVVFQNLKSISLVLLIGFCSVALASDGIPKKDLADTQAAIIMINHVNWVVNNVKNTNDVGILELEYEGISLNKLNLQSIKDEEVIDQITIICNFITERRISDGERKMLTRELNYNLDNAIYDAFPSPGAIVAADPWAIAYNLVQSSVSSYMNYKKAVAHLKIQHERQMWELEKDAMRELNGMNVDLLQEQWRLVQEYKLDDYWRVSEEQIKELLSRLNSPISEERPEELFEYLNSPFQRKKYQKLPAYWYYLGVTADKVKSEKIALEAYSRYQKEFYQVLRFDRMAASVAMNKLLIMLRGKYKKSSILEQLQIIEKNAPDDWTFLYFCAGVYLDTLKDKVNAERVLNHAISILQFQFSDTLFTCRDLCKKKNLTITDHTIPNATPLIACHALRLRIYGYDSDPQKIKGFLAKFQKDSARNCFGMLSFAGKLPFDDIEEYLKPELRPVFIDYQFEDSTWKNSAPYRFVLYMPLSWFFAGRFNIEFTVHFDDGTEPLKLDLHPRFDKKQNPVILDDELVRYVFDCPSNIVRKASPEKIEVKLAHKFYPVTLVFDAKGLKNAKARDVDNLRMYAQKAKYKKHTISVR